MVNEFFSPLKVIVKNNPLAFWAIDPEYKLFYFIFILINSVVHR